MKKADTKIERYKEGDWYIDIIDESKPTGASFEAWLSNKHYGISMLMFGMELPKKLFLKTIEDNLKNYQNIYIDNYFDDPPWDF